MKSILNKTSRKKREVMLSYSNTDSAGASQPIAASTAFVNGNATGFFVFCPTARDLTLGGAHTITQESMRTSQTCFQRGFSEHLRIQTSSGIPWFHRRICFTTRGGSAFNTGLDLAPVQPYGPYVDTINGMERLWLNQTVNLQPLTTAAQTDTLFRGKVNKDWNDIILAPVDTTRVSLKFDKTWCIKSGNASGTIAERKLWHGMGKNLVFDDDQNGEIQDSSHYSVDSKAGMGDYYIVDIFTSGLGATSSDKINVYSNATMYWHEK